MSCEFEQVVGMDVNASIVEAVNGRRCTSSEPGLAEGLAKAVHLSATTDMAAADSDAKLIFILVPTPNSGGRDYYNHRCAHWNACVCNPCSRHCTT